MNKNIIIALAALTILLVQPFYTWFTADDFCLIGKVQADGLISNMFHEYLTWDGRSISLTYPICRLGLWLGKYWVGPMVGTLLLLALAVMILRALELKSSNRITSAVQSVSLAATLWLGFFNFSAQTLYWTTGVGYIMDLVLLMAAIWLYKVWKPTWNHYLLGIPIYFYAGTCSPNGVLALLVIFFIEHFYNKFINKEKDWLRFGYALAIIIPACLIVILSPGNARRMSGMSSENLTHIWTIYFNIKWLFMNLWKYNTIIVWGMLAMGLLGALKQHVETVVKSMTAKLAACLYYHRYVVGAAVAFLFFLANPALHAARTNIQFVFFVFLYGLTGGKEILNSFINQRDKFVSILQTLVLTGFCIIAGTQLFDARIAKSQLAQRDARLRELRGTSVVLTEADFIRPPYTRRFEDLAVDSSYWINKCVADYYGLKSIKMIDTRKQSVNYGQMAE
jgi:hypothetical protein